VLVIRHCHSVKQKNSPKNNRWTLMIGLGKSRLADFDISLVSITELQLPSTTAKGFACRERWFYEGWSNEQLWCTAQISSTDKIFNNRCQNNGMKAWRQ
jgi:hypothetical protein